MTAAMMSFGLTSTQPSFAQGKKVIFHVTSVRSGEVRDWCTTGKCSATKFTVEGYAKAIFPNGAGKHACLDSITRRVILPALNVCGVCSKPESEHGRLAHKYERNTVLPKWHGWHAFRRVLATNLNRLGIDDSVIQRILRHSTVAVTQACYIKTAANDAKQAMQKFETVLNDTNVTPKQIGQITKAVI